MAENDITEELGDPEEQREQLLEETEAEARQYEQEQAELLEAVKEGEEYEHDSYEWVELGTAEIKVKAWLPGDVIDTLEGLAEAEQDGNAARVSDVVDAAIAQTEVIRAGDVSWSTDVRIRDFWEQYYEEHGDTVLEVAAEEILDPALENQQGRVPDGFRQQPSR